MAFGLRRERVSDAAARGAAYPSPPRAWRGATAMTIAVSPFHLASGIHSHSGLALAEPYRREGVVPLERLPA